MKTKRRIIITTGATAIFLILIIGLNLPNGLSKSIPCSLELNIPEAEALIAHQTVEQTYKQADVVVIGTITESYPCQKGEIVTRMTVEVEEYLKNPLDVDKIGLESRGGEIPGIGGTWVEDEKIFDVGDNVLLFLYEPKGGFYKINPYSTLIVDDKISGMDLIKGVELRADDNRIVLGKGETKSISMVLDSFFGYNKLTPISIAGFTIYDSETGDGTPYENPADLDKFGIHIESVLITPEVDGSITFDLPIKVDENAKEGKYFVELLAKTPEPTESMKFASWKIAHKQIQVIVENEN